jgi:hypothetical protein
VVTEEADLDNYDVRVMRPGGTTQFISRSNYVSSNAPDKEMVSANYLYGEDTTAPVFLMMPASYLGTADESGAPPANATADIGGTHVA